MFAIEPKTDCPHIESEVDPQEDDGPGDAFAHHNTCSECADPTENWVCLHSVCKSKVFCSRYVNSHMSKHNEATGHAIALSFSDLSIWCYKCDSYITHPTLKNKIASAYRAKFGSDLPMKKKKKRKQFKTLDDVSSAASASSSTAGAAQSQQIPSPDTALFVYGSLCHVDVRKKLLGGVDTPVVIPAQLKGYTAASVAGRSYPGLVETPNAPEKAAGALLGGLTEVQFKEFDEFESTEYKRITVVVEVGTNSDGTPQTTKAFTYVWANPQDPNLKPDAVWNYDAFVANDLQNFLKMAFK